MKAAVFIWLLIAAIVTMCVQKSATSSKYVEGNWYVLNKDSSYQEAFFSKGKMWSYSEQAGAVSRSYSFIGDSIIFYTTVNVPLASFKVSRFGSDQLIFSNGELVIKYRKLDIDIDIFEAFTTSENALQKYVMEFRSRQSAKIPGGREFSPDPSKEY